MRQHPEQHISISLKSADLSSEALPTLLSQKVSRWQLRSAQTALELTERGFAGPKNNAPPIAKHRQTGHSIYTGDFGTDYSNLSYSQDLDVDTLRIDKLSVDTLEYNNAAPHIIEITRTLRLGTAAESTEAGNQEI